MNKQCLFIGIDGGDWQILDLLIEKGYLSNLAKLKQKGVAGQLNSTIPELTAPAWSSFLTGVNPGKHGIFFWQTPWREEQKRELLTNKNIQTPQLPQILSEADIKVGLLNVPFSYPVKKVNGYQVAGMLTPVLDKRSVYPKSILADLEKLNYRIGSSLSQTENKKELLKFFNQLKREIQIRVDTFLRLNEKFQPQFKGIVFVGIDRVNHLIYRLLYNWAKNEKKDPENELVKKGLKVYQTVDQAIGKLVKEYPKSFTVIVSDHGFRAINKKVNFNRLLVQKGWIKPKLQTKIIYQLYRLFPKKLLSRNLRFKVREFFNFAEPGGKDNDYNYIRGHLLKDRKRAKVIDITESKLIPGKTSEQGIYLLDGTIKNEVIAFLEQLKDPQTDEFIVEKVEGRDNIYWGEAVKRAPDIVFRTQDKYYQYSPLLLNQPLISNCTSFLGGKHRYKGIFLVKPIQNTKKDNYKTRGEANIWDVLPTILNYFNIKKPDYMDGKELL